MTSTVTTTGGMVQGPDGSDVLAFRGVPFAAPPVGALRFMPPQPVVPWDGVLDASRSGQQPPQAAMPGGLGSTTAVPIGEDCLTLDVYTPSVNGSRPVMVWIYGGGYAIGASAGYNGAALAARGDVVVVSINYRVGAFGFSYLEHLDPRFRGSGNTGLLDQVAALEWVRDNIAAFGGDASCVTIFGESAGGHSVASLLCAPQARGLFHRGIPQSGAGFGLRSVEWAKTVTAKVMETLDVHRVDELQAVPMDRLLEAQAPLSSSNRASFPSTETVTNIGSFGFAPTLDDVVFTAPLIELVAANRCADVPLLITHTRDEMKLFPMMGAFGVLPENDEEVATRLSDIFPDSAAAAAAYRRAEPDATSADLYLSALTDQTFHLPDFALADAQVARGGDAWVARFSWPSPAFDGSLGAHHGIDVGFLFPRWGDEASMLDAGPPPQSLVDSVQDAWAAFARSGDPNVASLPDWPQYELPRRAAMELDTPPHVIDDIDGSVLATWDGLPIG